MIGIVNYGAGNIFSLTAALNRLNLKYGMINSESEFDLYDRIIIPGVGHAGAATKPVLGICVGMQLITDFSEEGNSEMLGIIPIKTLKFKEEISKKVPHMGWNTIFIEKENLLFKEVEDKTYFYFVHSYYIEFNSKFTISYCNYGTKFSASIQKNNFYGVQFHPEKSGEAGEKLLQNFAQLKL
jgi:glutamine amidotransferase